jgi:hypothetical protein
MDFGVPDPFALLDKHEQGFFNPGTGPCAQ